MFCLFCVVAVCLCVWGQGWGLGGAGFVVGFFLCQKYPVNYFSLLYYRQLFYDAFLCAYINCFLSQGNWCSQFMGPCMVCVCVCECSQLHGFIFSIFRGSFIAGNAGLSFLFGFWWTPVALWQLNIVCILFHNINPNTIKSYKILQKLSPKHAAHGVAQSTYPNL